MLKLMAFILSLIALAGFFMTSQNKIIRIAFNTDWITTRPYLQNNRNSGAIIANIYEPLIFFSQNGTFKPLAAKSWKVNADYTKFTFFIDQTKKFSNGTPLTAKSFKDSWEFGISQKSKSFNSSLKDVLYKIQGYENINRSGTIDGIKVVDKYILEINFATPFRQALDELSTHRFSAFLLVNGKCLGTNRYIIQEEKPQFLKLIPNPFYPGSSSLTDIEVSVCHTEDTPKCVTGEKPIDIFENSKYFDQENIVISSNFKQTKSQAAKHTIITLNGNQQSIFSNQEFRQAFQYLVHFKMHPENLLPNYTKKVFEKDSQTYLPFQKGRLNEKVVENLILNGKRFSSEFIKQTHKTPLKIITNRGWSLVKKQLDEFNISYSVDSKNYSFKEILNEVYNEKSDADIIFINSSIVGHDPDGIYHLLGKNGAIHSPHVSRDSLMAMLEKGRVITKKSEIDSFYQQINQEILITVPYVHLGFLHGSSIYNSKKIKINTELVQRRDSSFHIYSLE